LFRSKESKRHVQQVDLVLVLLESQRVLDSTPNDNGFLSQALIQLRRHQLCHQKLNEPDPLFRLFLEGEQLPWVSSLLESGQLLTYEIEQCISLHLQDYMYNLP